MADVGLGILQEAFGRVGNIVPQGLPVLGSVPDVGALVYGHLKLNSAIEEVVDVSGRRLLHANISLTRRGEKRRRECSGS